MGMVIAWPDRREARIKRRFDDNEPRGVILFFTGIRYERHDDSRAGGADLSSKRQRASRGRRKRA